MGGGGKGGGSQTIGYRYYLGLHMMLCHGPVSKVGPIYAGERQAYGGTVTYTGAAGTSEQSIAISAEELFGGEKKEGGIAGKVDICFGADDQSQNAYLLSQSDMTVNNLPAYRGVVSAIANKCYVAAMNPYPKPWWFRIESIPGDSWYTDKASINPSGTGTSANGAHMIRECIINEEWGMGYSHTIVDDTSFQAAADTLYDEGFGLSMILANQGSIEEFIQEILKHINGVLYTDRATGLFVLSLIRDDYTIGSLPIFDDSNIVSLDSFQRPTFAEMVNEVSIIYRKRGDFEDSSIAFQDLASVQAQGGIVSQTKTFIGIDDPSIAAQVGVRELKQQSTPLAQVELTVNREGWDLNPGDVFVFKWPDYGIDQLVLRVLKANYGGVLEGRIKLSCIEDVFGLPSASYVEAQDPIWSDPVTDPAAVPESLLQEATYYELATGLPLASRFIDDLDPSAAYLIYMAKPPSVASPSFELWTSLTGSNYVRTQTGTYTVVAALQTGVSYTDTTFQLDSLGFGIEIIKVNSYAFIGNEIVRIDSINTGTNQVTVGRGCIDTIPEEHSAGAEIWFGKDNWAFDYTEYAQGNNVYAKALVQTGFGTLPIGSAVQEVLTMVGRADKPYPVARVSFQSTSSYFPSFVYGTNATRVYFVNRNRLQQTVYQSIEDWFDGNITPEVGLTYTFNWFGELDINNAATSGSRTDTGVTSSPQSWSYADELADSGVGEYSPPDGWGLHMTLGDSAIGGTLSPLTTAQNITNVTFTDRATFAGGYMDIGDFSLSTTAFTISLIFTPVDTGDDYQLLVGKHTNDGTGGSDILGIYWRRANQRFYVGYGTSRVSVGSDGDVRPGRKHELMIVRNSSVTYIYLSGKLLGQVSHGISSWTGRSWVLGADWDPSDSVRNDLFQGTMWDLRIWDSDTKATTELWPVDRVNRYYRVTIVAIRSAVNSLQTFDFTVDDRGGWTMDWGNNYNGRNT